MSREVSDYNRTQIHNQYEFAKSSRDILLAYCKTLHSKDFTVENTSFGRGSIRNLLVHTGNTYEFWIGQALRKNIAPTKCESIKDVNETKVFFAGIDSLVEEFINASSERSMIDMEVNIPGKVIMASPLKLFTHLITHEFHHKGQILSLSRHLGYVPVDTDIIR